MRSSDRGRAPERGAVRGVLSRLRGRARVVQARPALGQTQAAGYVRADRLSLSPHEPTSWALMAGSRDAMLQLVYAGPARPASGLGLGGATIITTGTTIRNP